MLSLFKQKRPADIEKEDGISAYKVSKKKHYFLKEISDGERPPKHMRHWLVHPS